MVIAPLGLAISICDSTVKVACIIIRNNIARLSQEFC